MKTIIRLLTVAFLIASVTEVRAEKVKMNGPETRNLKQTTAGCTPSSTYAWLNINNARVRVNAGGDMWWDLPGGSGSIQNSREMANFRNFSLPKFGFHNR